MFGRLAGYNRYVFAHRRAALCAVGAVLASTNGLSFQKNYVSTQAGKVTGDPVESSNGRKRTPIQIARANALHFLNNESEEKQTNSFSNSSSAESEQICSSVSVYTSRGPRFTMEDEYYISNSENFFAVYDGHGGSQVSKYVQKNLYKQIKLELKAEHGIAKALMNAFSTVSKEILNTPRFDMEGSTAVTVLLQNDCIWTANLGDSRAVLCRDGESVDITEDHKPNSDSEKERIEALGGNVKWFGYLGPDRQPVPGMGAYRINGNLAVSRAFGDRLETPYVSDEPDICCFTRDQEADRFIIIASDGLWDVMTGKEAVRFVQQILAGSVGALGRSDESGALKTRRPSRSLSKWMRTYSGDTSMVRAVLDTRKAKIAKYLVEESLRRGTSDNVTVMVIWLR